MENRRVIEIKSKRNGRISIGVTPGHFATSHSHVNYYLDVNSLKSCYKTAKETAKVFCTDYINTPIDTIICLEGTQVVGAFLAEQLSDSRHSVNEGRNINIITPEQNTDNKMIFRDNVQKAVWDANILLLISSVSTGRTIGRCMECLTFYSGNLVGIASMFSAIEEANGLPVKSIFYKDDLPDYRTCAPSECPDCRDKKKVDAVINDNGYSKV
jgi:orotate phosphoribosyltransferase